MRFVTVLCVTALTLGICSAVAFADKDPKSQEPEWQWDLSGARAVYPEVEPNNSCAEAQPMACGDVINPARIDAAGDNDYYSFQGTVGIPITVGTDASELCDPDAGDTYIYLLDQNCAQLITNDDGGPGLYSLISNYNPPYTGTYYVRVRHYSSSGTGCYKMFVNCAPPATGACCLAGGVCQVATQAQCGTLGGAYQGDNTVCNPNPCPQPPPNDTCAGAIELPRCNGGTIDATLAAATNDYSPTNGCTGYSANGKDVVYVLNVQAGDVVYVQYTTPSYDGSIYILSNCADMASCVIGEDDPEPETFTWPVVTTGTYYLIADAYTTNGGAAFTLVWSITCPPPSVACCFPDGHCEFILEDACLQMGGLPMPGVLCDPNPCEQPAMACCFDDGHCEFVIEMVCLDLGGHPQGFGTDCDPNDCPQPPATGACCIGDQGDCRLVTQAECANLQGVYQGDGTTCEPVNPCPIVPSQNATWGQIKANYR